VPARNVFFAAVNRPRGYHRVERFEGPIEAIVEARVPHSAGTLRFSEGGEVSGKEARLSEFGLDCRSLCMSD